MGEWIKVSERLPDRNQGYIIVFTSYKDVEAFDTRSLQRWSNKAYVRFFENNDIVFWLPIPAPPEAEIGVDASCCAGVTSETHQAALTTMKMCQINVIGE